MQPTDEELFKKYPERRDTWPTQNMLGRLSKPEEYRGAAVFLLSDASSFRSLRCRSAGVCTSGSFVPAAAKSLKSTAAVMRWFKLAIELAKDYPYVI